MQPKENVVILHPCQIDTRNAVLVTLTAFRGGTKVFPPRNGKSASVTLCRFFVSGQSNRNIKINPIQSLECTSERGKTHRIPRRLQKSVPQRKDLRLQGYVGRP